MENKCLREFLGVKSLMRNQYFKDRTTEVYLKEMHLEKGLSQANYILFVFQKKHASHLKIKALKYIFQRYITKQNAAQYFKGLIIIREHKALKS